MNRDSTSARIFGMLQLALAIGLAFDASAMDAIVASPPKSVCERTHADALTYLKVDPSLQFVFDYDEGKRSFDPNARIPGSEMERLRSHLASGAYASEVSYEEKSYLVQLEPRFITRIANSRGDWNLGLCWWHSRMQRAAVYLVDFDPTAKKATKAEAKVIFAKLSHFEPVVLPGYQSFANFSYDFKDEFTAELSRWQKRTTFEDPGIALGAWARKTFSSEEQLYRESSVRLDGLLNDMQTQPRPIFIMLSASSGLHSFLITGFHASGDGTVRLQYFDSAHPGNPHSWMIRWEGVMILLDPSRDTAETYLSFHTQFEKDFDAIEAGLRTKCGQNYRIRTR